MAFVITGALLVLIFSWSALLWGYRDRNTEPILPVVEEVFDPRCLPIVLEHDPPAERAIIMIHGYPSTPYSYDFAAHVAYDHGYDVYVPLLPGFGTKPQDLYDTTFTQWYAYMEQYYRDKRADYKKLFVGGTSMGGSMALKLGERFSDTEEAPDGIATPSQLRYSSMMSPGSNPEMGLLLHAPGGAVYPGVAPADPYRNEHTE
jgi:carboxylesterase